MGIPQKALGLILFLCMSIDSLAAMASSMEHRIFYLAHQGKFEQAITLYKQVTKDSDAIEYGPLQQLALVILQRAVKSKDPLEQLLGFYGAALSGNTEAMSLLMSGLEHPVPQIQLISMDLLGRLGGDESEVILQKSASSTNILARLLALQMLLRGQHPVAFSQLEALYRKVPAVLHPLFPSFFGLSHDPRAMRTLRRMLNDPSAEVRIATLLTIAQQGKEELKTQLRLCIGRLDPREQEVGAYGAGVFRDREAIPLLLAVGTGCPIEVRLARLLALEHLGVNKETPFCIEVAKRGNLFAIQLLSELEGGVDPLIELCKSSVLDVRYNAALALLKKKDKRALPYVMELLIEDPRDLAINRIQSPGKTLEAYRISTSAVLTHATNPEVLAESLEIRKQILANLLTLPTEVFFDVAKTLFQRQQKDLVPTAVDFLVKIGSKQSQELLREAQNQVGAPFVRMCCVIGLYRVEGSRHESKKIREWLMAHKKQEMVEINPTPVVTNASALISGYTLSPQEDTLLFLQALEAVVEKQQEESISIVLDLLASGHVKNQPVLAGLLLRATQ